MKCHMPATFAAALLNSQPMGFYAPAQIVRDAREHGVVVLPPDVNMANWDCDLEGQKDGVLALRLGMNQIKGLRKGEAALIENNRQGGYRNLEELSIRAGIQPATLEILARADAFQSLSLSRRQAFWQVRGLNASVFKNTQGNKKELPLFNALLDGDKNFVGDNEPEVSLPVANLGEEVIDDYSSLKLSLKSHPLSLLRNILSKGFYKPISVFTGLNDGDFVSVAGLVLVRQRPSTAKGVLFITIEDDTGVANLVIWSCQFERFKRAVMNAKLLGVTGKLQREGEVVHLIVQHLQDLTFYLSELPEQNQCQPVTSSNFIDNAKIQMSKNTVQSAKNKKSDGKIARVNFNSRDFH